MDLIDGLRKYKSGSGYAPFTVPLEARAQSVLHLLRRHQDEPPASALAEAKRFLVDVEAWKADCDQQRMVNAQQNPERDVWDAFQQTARATTDLDMLLAIMKLKGFGSSVDPETGKRRAKVATAVLRFFWPERWGVVDWRVAVMRGLLDKHGWNVDAALAEARGQEARDLRPLYDILDENDACELNHKYRAVSQAHPEALPRAADVDMALFGLSLEAWPMRW